MPPITAPKTTAQAAATTHAKAAAGPDGAALTPPSYGMAVADQGSTKGGVHRGAIQRQASSAAGSNVATQPASRTGLPDSLQAGIEALSGLAMDDVRVHYNSSRPAQLRALAYTQGTEIHVAPGQERHLPHEAWHVVQQKQGRVRPTIQMKGIEVNDDAGLEREADVMSTKALQKSSYKQNMTPQHTVGGSMDKPITQLMTTLHYPTSSYRAGWDEITDLNHKRESHSGIDKKLAAWLSGYDHVDDAKNHNAKVCNHYVAYSMISGAIRDKLVSFYTLTGAVTWLEGLKLLGEDFIKVTPTKNTSLDWNELIRVGEMPGVDVKSQNGAYAEHSLNEQVDDLIFNLANDPRNLFYWPQSTGDNGGTAIDEPYGQGAMDVKKLNKRLNAYAVFLKRLGL